MTNLISRPDIGGTDEITIGQLIALAKVQPQPVVKFIRPPTKPAPIQLAEGDGQGIGEEQTKSVIAVGLHTCAAICFAGNEKGYVYHANAGSLTHDEFQKAVDHIDLAARKILVCYAHRGKSDSGYKENIDKLLRWGITSDNLVEVENWPGSQFGMTATLSLIGT